MEVSKLIGKMHKRLWRYLGSVCFITCDHNKLFFHVGKVYCANDHVMVSSVLVDIYHTQMQIWSLLLWVELQDFTQEANHSWTLMSILIGLNGLFIEACKTSSYTDKSKMYAHGKFTCSVFCDYYQIKWNHKQTICILNIIYLLIASRWTFTDPWRKHFITNLLFIGLLHLDFHAYSIFNMVLSYLCDVILWKAFSQWQHSFHLKAVVSLTKWFMMILEHFDKAGLRMIELL